MKSKKKYAEILEQFQIWRQKLDEPRAKKACEDFAKLWPSYHGVFKLHFVHLYPADCMIFEVENAVGKTIFIMPGSVEVISTDFKAVETALFKFYINERHDFEE